MLAWIAHLRYLNRLCSSNFLQSIMLSRYGQWLAMDALRPTVQQLMKYFAKHTEIPNAGDSCRSPDDRMRQLSVLRCCQTGKGDEVDLVVSFVALLRAYGKRARLVRSFQLRLELLSMVRQLGGDASFKTQSLMGELGVGLSVSLAAEKASLPEADYADCLAYACMQKPSSAMDTWVEFFDEFSGDWCAVDPVACVICPTLSGHWLHRPEGYTIAADDALKGKEYFYLTDLTERYQFHWRDVDKDLLSEAEQDTVRRKAWWKSYLKAHTELENCLDLVPRCPEECELVLQAHPLHRRAQKKRQATKRVHRKRGISDVPSVEPLETATAKSEPSSPWPMEDRLEAWPSEPSLSPEPPAEAVEVPQVPKKKFRKVLSKVRRRVAKKGLRKPGPRLYQSSGISGFPSVEPFEENARQLQRHLATTGLAPWSASQNSQERELAAFVENVKKLRALGRLKSHVQKKLMDCCPLWKNLEVGSAAKVATKEVLQAGPMMAEQNSQKSRGCIDLKSVRAALQLSRCQEPAERRNLLRKLQVSFHPDKNRDQEEASREMFELVQKMWEKEFK